MNYCKFFVLIAMIVCFYPKCEGFCEFKYGREGWYDPKKGKYLIAKYMIDTFHFHKKEHNIECKIDADGKRISINDLIDEKNIKKSKLAQRVFITITP